MHEIIITERVIQDNTLIKCGVVMNGKKDGEGFIVSIGGKSLCLHKSKCIILNEYCDGIESTSCADSKRGEIALRC